MSITDLDLDFEDVVLEVAFPCCAIWEDHLAVSVLDALDPLSVVAAAINPVHLSIAVSLIFLVFTLIDVATCPLEDTLPVFPIIDVITLIRVAGWTFCASPLAFAVLHAAFEIAYVCLPVCP